MLFRRFARVNALASLSTTFSLRYADVQIDLDWFKANVPELSHATGLRVVPLTGIDAEGNEIKNGGGVSGPQIMKVELTYKEGEEGITPPVVIAKHLDQRNNPELINFFLHKGCMGFVMKKFLRWFDNWMGKTWLSIDGKDTDGKSMRAWKGDGPLAANCMRRVYLEAYLDNFYTAEPRFYAGKLCSPVKDLIAPKAYYSDVVCESGLPTTLNDWKRSGYGPDYFCFSLLEFMDGWEELPGATLSCAAPPGPARKMVKSMAKLHAATWGKEWSEEYGFSDFKTDRNSQLKISFLYTLSFLGFGV